MKTPLLYQKLPVLVRALVLMVCSHFFYTWMIILTRVGSHIEVSKKGAVTFGAWEGVFIRSALMLLACFILPKFSLLLPYKLTLNWKFTFFQDRLFKWLVLRGMCGTLSMASILYTSSYLPTSIVALSLNTSTPFVSVLAHVFLKERMTPLRASFTIIGFLGVFLILYDGIFGPHASGVQKIPAQLGLYFVALLSGLLAAFAYFAIRKMKHSPPSHSILSLGLSGVFLASLVFTRDGFHYPASVTSGLCYLISALCGTIAQFLLTDSYRMGPAAFVSMGQYMGPVFSAVLGYFLFDEKLSTLALVGMFTVIIFGVSLPFWEGIRNKDA